MTKILVVEDDHALAQAIIINLKARDYEVQVAQNAADALRIAGEWVPDAMLLDLGLPDLSGLDVLRGTRGWSDMPILVVSARQLQQGKIEALDAGADDYITKPFAMGELLARLRAALRRTGSSVSGADPLVVTKDGHLRFDLANKQVWRDGELVKLTPNEWGIVDFLVKHQGKLVSKLDLLHAVWGENYNRETNYLRVYLSQVRQKLEQEPKNPAHFITELGFGYRFVV
ncbi:response regulator [Corynebacterium aquilae]|uniref:Fis family transcriptional regulator n=1 Tax=Corynebacterium aquilae DSM 44791 TaxID=1431546 RepID=A0A1L7CII5_9CORY|nr:response regulator [Corynebacterium aquilae]APT85583.1 Fis family transcriptional regulator [Corynebacterium aquilae DSM 44791]